MSVPYSLDLRRRIIGFVTRGPGLRLEGRCQFGHGDVAVGFVANPGIANLAKLAEQALADKDALPSYARTALEILIR